ncbi:MAG TPA: asparagine synthase (glutamine-hydrolyzing), partial [Kofleriaceae bacterium]|nr:asparagine synthase (glutamine-hydrolyzing) [Kofleriaceae bacterium]
AAGVFRDADCGLAHTRLAIIDAAGGGQPMADAAGELYLVFNGEIFNHVELRDELVGLGHRFRTRSDTEVVVEALRAWGEAALLRFNGQFALAAWRPRERTLLLARDRLGERPLYVCEHAGRVHFASEVKAIFAADPAIPRALDPLGLAETFTFWTVVAPRTAFAGVEELPPGHVRVYTPGGATERCYWHPEFPADGGGFAGSLADAAEAVRAALTRATELRVLRADVPVGCYLSGGLDSALVAALAQRIRGGRLRTFSLRFTDGEFDEGDHQRELVRWLGSDHGEIEISRAAVAAELPQVVRHVERPVLRTAPAPMLVLARHVRAAGIKVVLTGEGADEMFAGYDVFREARVRRFWAREPSSRLRPRLLDRLYPYLARSPAAARAMARAFFARDLDRADQPGFGHGPRWRAAAALQRVFSPALRDAIAAAGDPIAGLLATLPGEFARWDPLSQDQYLEIRTLLSGYVLASQGDRVAMASAVEARHPFLDPGVVELACALPADHKLHVLDEKHVLKRAAAGLVPDAIVRRPKQPYRAPDVAALCSAQLPAWIADELAPAALADAGVFDPDVVARLVDKCASAAAPPSNADGMALTGVLSTQLLHRQLIRARPEGLDRPEPIELATVIDHVTGHVTGHISHPPPPPRRGSREVP